jgi:hypothetical protein
MAFRQNNEQIFQAGMNDTAVDAQLAYSPFNNGTISFGVSTEQIFTPVHSRAGNAPQPGNQLPVDSIFSQGRFGASHCGPTSSETNPYFPSNPNDEWGERDFQEGCDFLLAHNNTQDTNLSANDANHIRGMGLRAPMLVSGWGWDLADRPVPAGGGGYTYAADVEGDRRQWKTGPVDLKWDEERQVWSGGPHIVCGVVEGGISKPANPCSPTTFTVRVLRLEGSPAGGTLRQGAGGPCETIEVSNRDPSLEEPDLNDGIFCIAVRLNYEWLPIWIGCPDEPISAPCLCS